MIFLSGFYDSSMFIMYFSYFALPHLLHTFGLEPSSITFVQSNFTPVRLQTGHVPRQLSCFFATLPLFVFAILVVSLYI